MKTEDQIEDKIEDQIEGMTDLALDTRLFEEAGPLVCGDDGWVHETTVWT